MDQRRERGSRWDPPFVTQSNPATNADFIQAEIHDSLRGKRARNIIRGKRWEPPWTVTSVATTTFAPQFTVRRGRVLGLVRRGRISFVSSVATAPGTISQGNRRRASYIRRGRRLSVIDVGVDAFFGLWKPPSVRARIKPTLLRRGRRWETVGAGADILYGLWKPALARARAKSPSLRRGKRLDVVQAQAVAPPPTGPALPRVIRPRVKHYLLRRGRINSPPWVGAALNAFVWYPKQVPRRIRVIGLLPKRSKRTEVMQAQQQPVQRIQTRPRGVARQRRRKQQTFEQMVPMQAIRSARPKVATMRRGRLLAIIPAQVVVQVVRWVPGITRARHYPVLLRVGRRFNSLRLIRALHIFPPIDTGDFARGDEGSTATSQTGETAGPSEGDIL
jgi:hypothetical protein